jgi:hypothetical protein
MQMEGMMNNVTHQVRVVNDRFTLFAWIGSEQACNDLFEVMTTAYIAGKPTEVQLRDAKTMDIIRRFNKC